VIATVLVGDWLKRVGPGGAVILLLVDVVDFDGSFPVDAVDILHPFVMNETVDVLLVANKIDLVGSRTSCECSCDPQLESALVSTLGPEKRYTVFKPLLFKIQLVYRYTLLPTQCTRTRVSSFARRRAKTYGLAKASGVHLVSAHTGMGIKTLSEVGPVQVESRLPVA
jgi:ribosome biogenesis GTPase A